MCMPINLNSKGTDVEISRRGIHLPSLIQQIHCKQTTGSGQWSSNLILLSVMIKKGFCMLQDSLEELL